MADKSDKSQPKADGTGGTLANRVAFWVEEVERASKRESNFRKQARDTIDRYEDEADSKADDLFDVDAERFNILFSNTETLRPSLYSGPPTPIIRRRHRDKRVNQLDEASRQAATALERAISFSVDQYDFDEMAESCVDDHLLPGRMQARVRYKAVVNRIELQRVINQDSGAVRWVRQGTMEPMSPDEDDIESDDDGNPQRAFINEMALQKVWCSHVPWDDFLHSKAKKWSKVWWVGFRDWLNVDEAREQFGPIAEKIDYAHESIPKERNESGDGWVYPTPGDGEELPKPVAMFWTIWNKRTRKVLIVADGLKERFVAELDDPLKLQGFFPCPQPVNSVRRPSSLVPIPEYKMYQDQAAELDQIAQRVARLIDAMRAVGAYDTMLGEKLEKIFSQADLTLVPVDNYQAYAERGGMNGIDWIPIDQYSKVVDQLSRRAAQLIQTIYEITGISDILRGTTDPRETAAAQRLKTQFGSRRLSRRSARIERFWRDLYRLKAEVIAEHFTREQLVLMTGVEISPQAMQLLQTDVVRDFLIDVETTTTAAPDEQREKQDVIELFQAMGNLMTAASASRLPPRMQAAMTLYGIRKFRAGRDIEDLLTEFMSDEQNGQPPPNPDVIKAQADAQASQQKLQQQGQIAALEQRRKDEVAKRDMARADAEARAKAKRERDKLEAEILNMDRMTTARIEQMQDEGRKELELRELTTLSREAGRHQARQAEDASDDASHASPATSSPNGNGAAPGSAIVIQGTEPEVEAAVNEVRDKMGELAEALAELLNAQKVENAQRAELMQKADEILELRDETLRTLQ